MDIMHNLISSVTFQTHCNFVNRSVGTHHYCFIPIMCSKLQTLERIHNGLITIHLPQVFHNFSKNNENTNLVKIINKLTHRQHINRDKGLNLPQALS